MSRDAPSGDGAVTQPDLDRETRTGVPEVILAEGKDPTTVVVAARVFVESGGRAIVSRARPAVARALVREFGEEHVHVYRAARMVVIKTREYLGPSPGGRVGIITAGTSDQAAAEEARVMAEEMGCEVTVVQDVGVAGLHRLLGPLHELLERGVDAIVVVAGMDGALASVVAGLVDVPVIGVPTSKGYGVGGGGLAPLLAMLQTCVPGLTVVNVDNGVGGGASAGRIARRAAAGRVRA